MASELDVELEQYEEVVGNLNFSTPIGSRSASPYQRSFNSFYLPRTRPTSWNYFLLCYYLSVARSCGFSCSNLFKCRGLWMSHIQPHVQTFAAL